MLKRVKLFGRRGKGRSALYTRSLQVHAATYLPARVTNLQNEMEAVRERTRVFIVSFDPETATERLPWLGE